MSSRAGISSAINELAAIEKMIQELMRKREDKMYEIEDMKAEAEVTQNQVEECTRTSMERLQLVGKRYALFSLCNVCFQILPCMNQFT
jgi:peptidoglycan hydrolase CwlO-like protein